MKPANKCILTINGGSSSIKFALFENSQALSVLLEGRIERIGLKDPTLVVKGMLQADGFSKGVVAPDHAAAAQVLINWFEEQNLSENLAAIGHRVVHGGPKYSEAQQITPDMISSLRELSSFDSEHLPAELLLIEILHRHFPDLLQVACFDTAFHHDMPRVARLLPIPRKYEALGVRRYGFHGLSYAFLMEELTRLGGAAAAQGRVVLAHLGSGASLAAVREGKSIDTSMSFTPTSGVPMSTRSGDLDPGLYWYFARTEKLDPKQFNDMVNFHSGLLGISETTSDMVDLLSLESRDPRAAEAIALFCYQIRKCIGSFAAALGGLDTLIFAGGIGENAPSIRARICDDLGFLGIELDQKRNGLNIAVISSSASRVAIRVIHTNEEKIIARSVCRIFGIADESADHESKRKDSNRMLIEAKILKTYKLHSLDGEIGKVKDFYLDDRHWVIRYMVVDTGNWLQDRNVLISPYALNNVIKDEEDIFIDLTNKQIEDSPSPDSDKPVSRQFENSYNGYYGLPPYWAGAYIWGPYPYVERNREMWKKSSEGKKKWNSHLRSIHEVDGYHIHATDGEIGHVEDFIIDVHTWAIRYLIVDTKNWWPGKKVMISPLEIERVSWREGEVFVNLSREAIKQSEKYSEDSEPDQPSPPSKIDEAKIPPPYTRRSFWVEGPVLRKLE